MIKLDVSLIVFIYLFASVVVVLGIWLFMGYRTKIVSFKKEEDYLWRCGICLHTYLDSKDEFLSKCPQCGSYNKRYNTEKTKSD